MQSASAGLPCSAPLGERLQEVHVLDVELLQTSPEARNVWAVQCRQSSYRTGQVKLALFLCNILNCQV